ncbi:HAMP domain-containing protein [Proteiniclasticum sp. BAD-10]|uniref:histidine kinase n=1 Tax=Proteiniclasticum sediminis TaxID=2804028 RepID=A0A941CP96_9CLOT|nr:ATP-binding protein [Proteiniclasticum sediminis]MBR0575559.1 HAMP domain-containing protein [Proteiniclasticum sediminis]
MNRRIVRAFLGTIVVAMLFLTSAFLIISNLQKIDMVEKQLADKNAFLITYLETGEDEVSVLKSVDEKTRMTLIAADGTVLYDSSGKTDFENHFNRKEIQDALKTGTGSDIRMSSSLGTQMIYFATRLPDGRFLRSAMASDSLNLGSMFSTYMGVAFLLVMFLSYLFAQRISGYLLEPIMEMTFATERIANGEYTRRVTVRKEADLAKLGSNFNHMAERLENTFLDNQEKQNRLEAILKSMNSGVFAYDNNDQIIIFNPFCKELFGIYGDVIGKNIYDIKELRELLFSMESQEGAMELRIDKPMVRDIRVKSAEIFGERVQRVGTVVVLEDITDLKKLEKMRSQFVANVSHELKTPLTSIKGFSETLKFVQDEKTRNKFLDIINEESERLTRLINDILTLSSIEQAKAAKPEFIDPVAETEKIYHLLTPRAEAKRIRLTMQGQEGLKAYCDRDNFKQLVLNLVDNAIKYTREEGSVNISLSQVKESLKIVVEDTGIGIPDKHLSRIFERFYRVDKARDRAMGGTGLGLAIVKHIVLGFGGTIDVESEVGKGTRFIIFMPIQQDEDVQSKSEDLDNWF